MKEKVMAYDRYLAKGRYLQNKKSPFILLKGLY